MLCVCPWSLPEFLSASHLLLRRDQLQVPTENMEPQPPCFPTIKLWVQKNPSLFKLLLLGYLEKTIKKKKKKQPTQKDSQKILLGLGIHKDGENSLELFKDSRLWFNKRTNTVNELSSVTPRTESREKIRCRSSNCLFLRSQDTSSLSAIACECEYTYILTHIWDREGE